MADELEKLYVDIGQWRQTIEDADRLEKEHKNWEIDFVNMGYQLPLWDHPLDLKEPCVNVNWEEGRRLAQSVGVRKNELYFWQQREPEVEQLEDKPDRHKPYCSLCGFRCCFLYGHDWLCSSLRSGSRNRSWSGCAYGQQPYCE